MGEVYRARDPKLNRDVAIKVLPESVAHTPESLARFRQEAQSIALLNHPNIVTIYSVEESAGAVFFTMELIEGKPLGDIIGTGGLALVRLLQLAIPLADAVSAAHQKGVTHRDLKPANVMVGADNRIKVRDFGLAKLMEVSSTDSGASQLPTGSLTGDGRIMGTVAYMAPEQAEGKPTDSRSDIFSLGVMLYEMATGERPFKGDTTVSTVTSILRDAPRSITEINPSLPRDLAVIVRRCLVKDPEQRTQSAKDLRNQLEDVQRALSSGELSAPATPVTELGRTSRWRWAATAVAFIVLGIVGTWMLSRPRQGQDALVVTQVTRFTHDPGLSEWPTWLLQYLKKLSDSTIRMLSPAETITRGY
jgi:serine/threonine-protein kinase